MSFLANPEQQGLETVTVAEVSSSDFTLSQTYLRNYCVRLSPPVSNYLHVFESWQ